MKRKAVNRILILTGFVVLNLGLGFTDIPQSDSLIANLVIGVVAQKLWHLT